MIHSTEYQKQNNPLIGVMEGSQLGGRVGWRRPLFLSVENTTNKKRGG